MMTIPIDAGIHLARRLAVRGDLAGALALLASVGQETMSPEGLVLKGKILFQQGRLADAVQAWQAALEQDPESRAAAAALRRARAAGWPVLGFFFRHSLGYHAVLATTIAGLLAASLFVFGARPGSATVAAQPPEGHASGATPAGPDTEALEQRLARLEESTAALASRSEAQRDQTADIQQDQENRLSGDLRALDASLQQHFEAIDARLAGIESQREEPSQIAADWARDLTEDLAGRDERFDSFRDAISDQLAGVAATQQQLGAETQRLQRQILGWRADELRVRHLWLPSRSERDRNLEQMSALVDALERLADDETWKEYVRALRTWIADQRP